MEKKREGECQASVVCGGGNFIGDCDGPENLNFLTVLL